MKTEQSQWSAETGWLPTSEGSQTAALAQLVFVFGCAGPVKVSRSFERAKSMYPRAHVVGCSTAGEIRGISVLQDSVVMTAVAFEHTRVEARRVSIENPGRSHVAGGNLARALPAEGLAHVFVLSDGLRVNASQLVSGITSALPSTVVVTGGFAGDGDRLSATHVWCDGEPEESSAVAVGFYGNRLKVSASATGAWGSFGPDRLITKSTGNVLYELDGHSALGLYKSYLGPHAADLPASGLLFPFLMHDQGSDQCVLRALLAINEENQSITFAGDVPEGAYARLMRGTIERLIEGTLDTARSTVDSLSGSPPDFSIVVSCNGRRHVLKQRIEEELEAVREVFGESAVLAGFYSYGEIGPVSAGYPSQLHNETLTITTFSEN